MRVNGSEVAQAARKSLTAVHDAGVVHRDIRASNLGVVQDKVRCSGVLSVVHADQQDPAAVALHLSHSAIRTASSVVCDAPPKSHQLQQQSMSGTKMG